MGALPSHETHERGLYSHRHGRNRRNEIILIPLTTAFFESPDCPLFRHLYNSRYRRTAKYYFRALRSAQTPRDSDYFCTTTAINEEAEFEKFYQDYLEKRELRGDMMNVTQSTATTGLSTASSPLLPGGSSACVSAADTGTAMGPAHAAPCTTPQQDCLNPQGLPSKVDPMDFRSYSDTREGLYQILIRDNAPGVFTTDEELRQAYWRQLQEQQTERQRACQHQREKRTAEQAAGCHAGAGGCTPHARPNEAGSPPTVSATTLSPEDLAFDDFVSGYVASKRYMKGKALHTRYSTTAAANANGDPISQTTDVSGKPKALNEYSARHYKHVTSPVAYDIRPLPCVIASRYDPGKPQPVDDPLYVPFGQSYVRIMGMFGFLPSTLGMRRTAGFHGTENGTEAANSQRGFPRKEGNCNGDDDIDEEFEVEQHLLKGTMFVDKDVGDQILGNMVMLATYMYVRQCIEARINPQAIPMLPVFLRFPLSNIPMLQFVREFRVRLRSLLEAGTAKAGQKPVHTGMSGFNPEDLAEPHDPQLQRLEEEGYLFEPDIPSAATPEKLFMSAGQASSANAPLRRHAGMNTLSCGKYPIIMMSGFNVQSTPLRHPTLNMTGYLPAMAAEARRRFSFSSPQSGSVSVSPHNPNGAVGGVGCASTFPSMTLPPPPPAQAGAASASNSIALSAPAPPPPSGVPFAAFATAAPGEEARKISLLRRRKQRFRIWVEDGHICIWSSAAYARRAALIMAQQLNTTVDSNSVPEQRSWNYRGLLHANTTVPPPRHLNDVIIVAEDIPSMDLWQGDVLRCCTRAELQAMIASKGTAPLPLPCTADETANVGAAAAGTTEHVATPVTDTAGAAANRAAGISTGSVDTPAMSLSTVDGTAATLGVSGHIHFTSDHVSNPLLQEKEQAPPEAFWVRGAGGLDDSFTNITETNVPPHPKAEKQLLQAVMQRAKKAAAAATVQNSSRKRRSTITAEAATTAAAQLFMDIDRREGTLNIEEVVLAWIKVVAILTRDSTEEDRAWVRDPQGNPVRIDRYVIRRYEHDGVRFFIGVTPRFVGQQRRIERVLGEVYALEERENRHRREKMEGLDNDRDDEDREDKLHPSCGETSFTEEAKNSLHSPLAIGSRHRETLSYDLGTSAAPSFKAPVNKSGVMGSAFDDVWGPPVMPMTHLPTPNASCTPAVPRTVAPKGHVTEMVLSAAHPRNDSRESVEQSSRLAFAAVFGNAATTTTTTTTAAAAASQSPATASVRPTEQELTGPNFDVDDLLKQFTSNSLFFGDVDDD